MTSAVSPPLSRRAAARRIYRHRLPVRVMHWVNAVALVILLMSGLTIFNAHPALYWGRDSNFAMPWLSIGSRQTSQGAVGVTTVGGTEFDTTGVLGLSTLNGEPQSRGFPGWATLPSAQWLAMGRTWHLFFAWIFAINGLCYLLYAIASGHLRRDLLPTRDEWRGIGTAIVDHLRFRHPTGEAARRYNVLQNIAYLVVIFVLLPLVVVAGLGMSPRLNAAIPSWVELLGGRQSARSLHFLAAMGLVLFTLIHVFEVLVSGVWNEIRSMVTGWYVLPADKAGHAAARRDEVTP